MVHITKKTPHKNLQNRLAKVDPLLTKPNQYQAALPGGEQTPGSLSENFISKSLGL